MHDRVTERRNVDAPGRFWRRIKDRTDRCAESPRDESPPPSAVEVGQPRLGPGELTGCAIDLEAAGGFGLPTTGGIERFVGGKTRGCHRISHRVRHQAQPDDPGSRR
jgi:hypothetical protein